MRQVLLVVVAWVLATAGPGVGSPLKGKFSLGVQRIPAEKRAGLELKFRGGERACVVVRGDHKPVVDLGLFVHDAAGTLVTKDEGGGDYVAVMWYPPRDAVYRITIFNPGKEYNDCYISLK